MSVRRSLIPVVAGLVVSGLSGCLFFEPMGEFWHQVKRNAVPSADDKRDFTEEVDEGWDVVGDEGRRDQEAEKDPDQWYRNYILSPKAREIEENLGFE